MKPETQSRTAIAKSKAFIFAFFFVYAICLNPTARAEQSKSDKLVRVSADVTLRVIEAGSPEAQAIILVPGWCFTADIWAKQIAVLSERYHVIAFDPRSQGRSTILDHSNSPDHRAEDIASLIKSLGLAKPVVVGWSQGVQDVAAYALKFGTAEVGGIVLVDSPVSSGVAGMDAKVVAGVMGRMQIYVDAQRDYLEGMLPYVFKKPLSPEESSTIISAAMQTPTSVGMTNLMLDLFGKDYRPSLKRFDVPTLLIVAGTAPDRNEQVQQPIEKATRVVVEGAGHAVFYDEPAKFNELLSRFLEELVTLDSGVRWNDMRFELLARPLSVAGIGAWAR